MLVHQTYSFIFYAVCVIFVSRLTPSCDALSLHGTTTRRTVSNNVDKEMKSNVFSTGNSRRSFISVATGVATSSLLLDGYQPRDAYAFPFVAGNTPERRQLELCLVTILRIRYWGENVSKRIQQKIDNGSVTTDIMKAPYLEARLGSKAALTGKVGGGANAQVYNLAAFQVRGCVKDAENHFKDYYKIELNSSGSTNREEKGRLKLQKSVFENASVDIIESLAAVVEFDGLENLTDASPRSSLALSQYTDKKALFMRRILLERTVPACNTIISSFGPDEKRFVETYVARTFPNEIPTAL